MRTMRRSGRVAAPIAPRRRRSLEAHVDVELFVDSDPVSDLQPGRELAPRGDVELGKDSIEM